MPTPKTVQWTRDNFDCHYQKHPVKEDRACWADLCGLSAPIPEAIYESASLAAWKYYKVCVSYVGPDGTRYITRIDDKLIRVIVIEKSGNIATCYHLHKSRNEHENPDKLLPYDKLEMITARLNRELASGRAKHHIPPIERITWPR